MTTLFISDLHLDASRPAVTELFGAFMQGEARHADALYILGDLFEAWVGDDDPSETGAYVAARIREVADAGVPVSIRRRRDCTMLLAASLVRHGIACWPWARKSVPGTRCSAAVDLMIRARRLSRGS